MLRKFLCTVFVLTACLAQAETKVIAALGDSLTAGYGLVPGEGFVPQLETALQSAGHDVRVINAGVSGDTSAGGLARLDWTLSDDVDAVIIALGGNDILRALDPAVTRENMEGILAGIASRELKAMVIGFKAPLNYGPEYKADFDAIYPDLSAQFGAVYHPEFLAALRDMDPSEGLKLMQADGLHPNKDGVALMVEDVLPMVNELLAQIPD